MARYFVKMPTVGDASAAAAFLTEAQGPRTVRRSKALPNVMLADLDEHDVVVLENQGADLYKDVQFEVLPGLTDLRGRTLDYGKHSENDALVSGKSLHNVLDHINAPKAWERSRGGGVTIAIVDTGICGTLKEFPAGKRSPVDLPSAFAGHHWTDIKGHGSMCAVIAGGSRAAGGRYDGVAPDATILSARTTLLSSDLYTIFDELVAKLRGGEIAGPLVISNSYGLYTCEPPAALPEDHPYLSVVLAAIEEGAFVTFAAGNNHYDELCNHDPAASSPNSIWGVNSHDRVVSVGTVDQDNSNQGPGTKHANSSRGPGQWAREFPKPDCVAPTYGGVVWGCGYASMEWWGTSGACPQVAGLGALLLGVDPHLRPEEVATIIRNTANPTGAPRESVGAGVIDCAAAVAAVS